MTNPRTNLSKIKISSHRTLDSSLTSLENKNFSNHFTFIVFHSWMDKHMYMHVCTHTGNYNNYVYHYIICYTIKKILQIFWWFLKQLTKSRVNHQEEKNTHVSHIFHKFIEKSGLIHYKFAIITFFFSFINTFVAFRTRMWC